MTYDERQQSICQQCGRGDTCGYVSRNLVRKCEYNSAVMQGWELGQEDAIEAFENNRLAACDHQTAEEAQREQDFATAIIEQEHRQPTFDDAIKYGMRLQR